MSDEVLDSERKKSLFSKLKLRLPHRKKKKYRNKLPLFLPDACSLASIDESEEFELFTESDSEDKLYSNKVSSPDITELRKYDDDFLMNVNKKLTKLKDSPCTPDSTYGTLKSQTSYEVELTDVTSLNDSSQSHSSGSAKDTVSPSPNSLTASLSEHDSLSSMSSGEYLSGDDRALTDAESESSDKNEVSEAHQCHVISRDTDQADPVKEVTLMPELLVDPETTVSHEAFSLDLSLKQLHSLDDNSDSTTLCSSGTLTELSRPESRSPTPNQAFEICKFTEDASPLDFAKDNMIFSNDICLNNSGILSALKSKTKQVFYDDPVYFESIKKDFKTSSPDCLSRRSTPDLQDHIRIESPNIFEEARLSSCTNNKNDTGKGGDAFLLVDEIDALNLRRSVTPSMTTDEADAPPCKPQTTFIDTTVRVFPKAETTIIGSLFKIASLFSRKDTESLHKTKSLHEAECSPNDNNEEGEQIHDGCHEDCSTEPHCDPQNLHPEAASLHDQENNLPTAVIKETAQIDLISFVGPEDADGKVEEALAVIADDTAQDGDTESTYSAVKDYRPSNPDDAIETIEYAPPCYRVQQFDYVDYDHHHEDTPADDSSYSVKDYRPADRDRDVDDAFGTIEYPPPHSRAEQVDCVDHELLVENQQSKLDDDSNDEGYSDGCSVFTETSTLRPVSSFRSNFSRHSSMETLSGHENSSYFDTESNSSIEEEYPMYITQDSYSFIENEEESGDTTKETLKPMKDGSQFIELPKSLQSLWDDDSELYDIIKFLGKWGKYNVVLEGTLDVGECLDEHMYFYLSSYHDDKRQGLGRSSSYLSKTRSDTIVKLDDTPDGAHLPKCEDPETDATPLTVKSEECIAMDASTVVNEVVHEDDDDDEEDCDCNVLDHLLTEFAKKNPHQLNHMAQKTLFCRSCNTPHVIELM